MFRSNYRYIFIALLSAYSYLNIKFTEGDQLFSVKLPEWILVYTIIILVILVWEGNHFIYRFFTKRIREKNAYSSLIYSFLISIIWVFIISLVATFIQTLFGFPFTSIGLKLAIGFTFRVNLFLHCVNAIIHYHNKLRLAEVDTEKLKKEQLNAQFESLRKQISPHFLFNSLNVLDGLIRTKDFESASYFVEKLSKVYRYLTSIQQEEIVKLSEELEFVKAYQYLLETRFKNYLRIDIDLNDVHEDWYIVPSALQMLIENSVKHNEISGEFPLTITIKVQNDNLIISNPIHSKKTVENSSGKGLANINKRYEFLGKASLEVFYNEKIFEVRVPLLKI